jgi:hypothetical protein
MVMARLHVICGNCGCNDELEWVHRNEIIDDGSGETLVDEDVSINCKNCATRHSLNDNAKKVTKGT